MMGDTVSPEQLKMQGLSKLNKAMNRLDHEDADGHEEALAEAAKLLAEAYQRGQKDPEVVWKLKQLWTDTGHLEEVVDLLKDYLNTVFDKEEMFLAGHYIVDTYALMSERGDRRANELAVDHHRKYMDELGPGVSPVRRLWSYSDATMTRAWSRTGHLDEWTSRSRSVYQLVSPENEESRRTIAYYLRTLSTFAPGGPNESIECEQRICELYKNDESPESFWLMGNARVRLYFLYDQLGENEMADDAKDEAVQLVGRLRLIYEDLRKKNAPKAQAYKQNGHMLCHDLGCMFTWNGDLEDGIAMFERALELKENALTRYFYAGVLLKARDDREGALINLKRAASDPRTSLIHRFEKEFRSNSSFSGVHDDPEFLAVVRDAAKRYESK